MFFLFAIPIVSQATGIATKTSSFFHQPIDAILFDILIWFGWIPIAMTLIWGFTELWQDYRRGLFSAKLKFTYLAVDVPSMTEQTPKAMENFFSNLYGTKSTLTWKEIWIDGKLHPVFSFEIVSSEGYIQFVIRTQSRFRDVIEAGIYAHYPDAQISEIEDYTKKFPSEFPNEEYEMWGGEMTLDKPDFYPIRTYVDFEDRISQEIKDPLAYTLEQIGTMRPGEHFWIQILVQPSTNDWIKPGLKYVNAIYGVEEKAKKSLITSTAESLLTIPNELLKNAADIDLSAVLFPDAEKKEEDQWKAFKITLPQKEQADAIVRKIGKVGHGVKIRVIYIAKKNAYVKVERTAIVKGIWNQYSHLNLNKFTLFIPQVPKDDYFWMRWVYTKKQRTLMMGYQKRSWGIGADPIFLNAEELATLWHFPTITMKAPLIKKSESKRGEPPVGLPITFEEQTLPGAADIFAAQEDEMQAGSPIAISPKVSQEELDEALPHPLSPTGNESTLSHSVFPLVQVHPREEVLEAPLDITLPSIEKQEEKKDDEDEVFAPPNLPT